MSVAACLAAGAESRDGCPTGSLRFVWLLRQARSCSRERLFDRRHDRNEPLIRNQSYLECLPLGAASSRLGSRDLNTDVNIRRPCCWPWMSRLGSRSEGPKGPLPKPPRPTGCRRASSRTRRVSKRDKHNFYQHFLASAIALCLYS